jgi:hypothetical protein
MLGYGDWVDGGPPRTVCRNGGAGLARSGTGACPLNSLCPLRTCSFAELRCENIGVRAVWLAPQARNPELTSMAAPVSPAVGKYD